jgi:hypothetical protein
VTAPENQTIEEEAFQAFTEGRWESLGITDRSSLRIRDLLVCFDPEGIPMSLMMQAERVWLTHKDRIVAEWTEKLDRAWEEQGDLYTDCQTCPNCGCPGMN